MRYFLRIFWKWFKHCLTWDSYYNLSWAQEGEDRILKRFLDHKTSPGFYIDVGAHHPLLFSNTKQFYNMGWRGINIDAMPGSMKIFRKFRKRDINLEFGVGLKKEIRKYHIYNQGAVNSFSKEKNLILSEKYSEFKLQKVVLIEVVPLSLILDKYLSPDQKIDFMTIDVEGLDFEVLKSNDWIKYRPHLVLTEVECISMESLNKNKVVKFMKSVGYDVVAKTVNTMFFLNKNI